MALKVGTEDKKKVYLASGLGLVMLILLGALPLADLWALPRTSGASAHGGHRAADRSPFQQL